MDTYAVFSLMLRTTSVYRGERTIYECLGSGAVCGALGGWMFRDKNYLFGIKSKGIKLFLPLQVENLLKDNKLVFFLLN